VILKPILVPVTFAETVAELLSHTAVGAEMVGKLSIRKLSDVEQLPLLYPIVVVAFCVGGVRLTGDITPVVELIVAAPVFELLHVPPLKLATYVKFPALSQRVAPGDEVIDRFSHTLTVAVC
jgi:hypothetical protein